jgi:hypothetical protein
MLHFDCMIYIKQYTYLILAVLVRIPVGGLEHGGELGRKPKTISDENDVSEAL